MKRKALKVLAVFALAASLVVVSVNRIHAEAPNFLAASAAPATANAQKLIFDRRSERLEIIPISGNRPLMAKKPLPTQGNIVEGTVKDEGPFLSDPKRGYRRRGLVGVFRRIGRGVAQGSNWFKNRLKNIDRKIVKPIKNKVIKPVERATQRAGERVTYGLLWPIKETGLLSEKDRRNVSAEASVLINAVAGQKFGKSPFGQKIKQIDEQFRQVRRTLDVIEEMSLELEIKALDAPSKHELPGELLQKGEDELVDAGIQLFQRHEKFVDFRELADRIRQRIEELPQREGYRRATRIIRRTKDGYEWVTNPETKLQRGLARWREKVQEKIGEEGEKIRARLRTKLGRPDIQKYRKRIEQIIKIRRLLEDPKYTREQIRLELEHQLALQRDKWHLKISRAFEPIRENATQPEPQPEMLADINPSGADCPTPVPEQAIHKVTDFSEIWSMPDGAKVGPAIEWYDKEKTKKHLLHCYNTKGQLHGYATKWFESNGKPAYARDYRNGKKNGMHTAWYEEPYAIQSIKTFKNDKLWGLSMTWAKDGRQLSKNVYENNQLKKRWRFDSKGNPVLLEIWSNGKLISSTKIEAGKK